MYRKALAVQEHLGNKRNQASAAGYLGLIYQQCQEPQKAKDMAHQALLLFEETENMSGIAWQAEILGELYCAEGLFECAEPMYRRSLAGQKNLGNDEACAFVQMGLGAMYAAWGKGYDAMLNWRQAQEMFRHLGRTEQVEDLQKMMAGSSY